MADVEESEEHGADELEDKDEDRVAHRALETLIVVLVASTVLMIH